MITHAQWVKVAVICHAEQITHEQLSRRAEAVAQRLIATGVERGSLVGLLVERSVDRVVGALAIHKAGAADVPFDAA